MSRIENHGKLAGLARFIGRASVDAEIIGQKMKEVVLFSFEHLNPLTTTNFTISNFFPEQARSVIDQAMQQSSLPENTFVAHSRDLKKEDSKPKSPFIVATVSPGTRDAREAFQAGALRYVTIDWDVSALVQSLDGKKL